MFGKIPCLTAGALLLSFTLFLRSLLKFESVGSSLMRNFDLYFPSDGPLFLGYFLTQRRLCESYSSD